eukprot:gene4412-14537_t
MDVAGTNDNDASSGPGLHMSIHKIRLDADGKKVGKAEYHTPGSQTMVDSGMGGASVMNVNIPQAMKHLVDMEEESDHREGCHVSGTMAVKRVAGRIHISVHQQLVFQMLPQLLGGHHIPHVYNMSHTIHTLSFGPKYPGLVNPLDATTRLVVPTEYYGRLGGVTETNQFSLTEYSGVTDTKMNQPSIELMYDISPTKQMRLGRRRPQDKQKTTKEDARRGSRKKKEEAEKKTEGRRRRRRRRRREEEEAREEAEADDRREEEAEPGKNEKEEEEEGGAGRSTYHT